MSNDLPHGGLSACPTGTSACHSEVEILGSGHVRLYPLDIFTIPGIVATSLVVGLGGDQLCSIHDGDICHDHPLLQWDNHNMHHLY